MEPIQTHTGIIYISYGFMYFCFLSALSLYIKMHTLDAASMFLAFNWARCEIIIMGLQKAF